MEETVSIVSAFWTGLVLTTLFATVIGMVAHARGYAEGRSEVLEKLAENKGLL